MHKHKSERKRLGGILPMSPLFVGFCAYGVIFWFLIIWIWLLVGRHPSTMKYVALGPVLGTLNLTAMLSIVHAVWAALFATWAWRYWRFGAQPRWVTLGSILAVFLALGSLELCNRNAAAAAATFDNDRVRTDAEMLAWFGEHEQALEAAVLLYKEVPLVRDNVERESLFELMWRSDTAWWVHHHDSLHRLGLRRDIHTSNSATRFAFEESVNAIGPRGTFKGYLYSEQPPSPLVSRLDDLEFDPEPGDRYRKIAGRWYLFVRNHR
jgi:hypothetical protein